MAPVPTQSIDVATVLFQTHRPRPTDKDLPAHAVWPDHGIPSDVYVERKGLAPTEGEKGERVRAAGPALVPETIVVDHGEPCVSVRRSRPASGLPDVRLRQDLATTGAHLLRRGNWPWTAPRVSDLA